MRKPAKDKPKRTRTNHRICVFDADDIDMVPLEDLPSILFDMMDEHLRATESHIPKMFEGNVIPRDKVLITVESDYNDSYLYYILSVTVPEPEEDYNKRVREWERKWKKYKAWYKDNYEIEQKKKEEKKLKRFQAKQKKLNQEMVKAKKHMDRVLKDMANFKEEMVDLDPEIRESLKETNND